MKATRMLLRSEINPIMAGQMAPPTIEATNKDNPSFVYCPRCSRSERRFSYHATKSYQAATTRSRSLGKQTNRENLVCPNRDFESVYILRHNRF